MESASAQVQLAVIAQITNYRKCNYSPRKVPRKMRARLSWNIPRCTYNGDCGTLHLKKIELNRSFFQKNTTSCFWLTSICMTSCLFRHKTIPCLLVSTIINFGIAWAASAIVQLSFLLTVCTARQKVQRRAKKWSPGCENTLPSLPGCFLALRVQVHFLARIGVLWLPH